MMFEQKIKLLAIVFPLSVTSWLRSAKHNAAVGGVPASQHLTGQAVDIVLDDNSRDGANFTASAKNLELQVIIEGDHYHVQEPRASHHA